MIWRGVRCLSSSSPFLSFPIMHIPQATQDALITARINYRVFHEKHPFHIFIISHSNVDQ